MITLTSGSNISQALSFDNNQHFRDASFSSYLPCPEETYVCKFSGTDQDPDSTITKPHEHLFLGKKKIEDGEIGIFAAEKYFNEGIDEVNPKLPNISEALKDEVVDISPAKPKLLGGIPSVLSESSWNSQSALLQSIPRNPPQRKANGGKGKSLLATFGCRCICNDKNSVEIDEQAGESESKRSNNCGLLQGKAVTKDPIKKGLETGDLVRNNKSRMSPWATEEFHCEKINERCISLGREDCFSFPILSSKPGNVTVKVHSQGEEDENQRKSLEVFGSPVFPKKNKSSSLERRLNMLTWEGNARIEELQIKANPEGDCNDAESDASSDLFEIESFTANSNPFLHGQASDGLSSCVTPRTCYAPSEASIEWSVLTASAADFSVVSDSEDQISSAAFKMNPNLKPGGAKEAEKRRSGILSGCKSHKAVTVAELAVRTSGKDVSDLRRCHRPDKVGGVTSFQAKS